MKKVNVDFLHINIKWFGFICITGTAMWLTMLANRQAISSVSAIGIWLFTVFGSMLIFTKEVK